MLRQYTVRPPGAALFYCHKQADQYLERQTVACKDYSHEMHRAEQCIASSFPFALPRRGIQRK